MISVLACAAAIAPPQYEWRNVSIVAGGFVSGIITHPKSRDLVYCRTDIGGAYRLDPASRRWIPLMDWITLPDWNLYGVESVAVDPSDPNWVYIAAGTYDNVWGEKGAILVSRNRGRSFTRVDLPFKNGGNMPGRSIGERLSVNPKNGKEIYFGTRNSGLWRSRDHGKTWGRLETFPKILAEYEKPVVGAGWERTPPEGQGVGWVQFGKGVVYAGVVRKEDPILESSDQGASWTPIPGQPKGLIPHQAKLDRSGRMVVVYGSAVGPNDVMDGAVWLYDPAGKTWTDITPEKPGGDSTFGYGGVTLDPKHPGVFMVSTLCRWKRGDTVFRTADGGKTWVSLKDNSTRDASVSPYLNWDRKEPEFGHWIGDVEIDPAHPNRAWYVTGATIWSTTTLGEADKGRTVHWRPEALGIEETAVTDLASPPSGPSLISALGDIGGFRHDSLEVSPPKGMAKNPLYNTVTDLDFAGKSPRFFVKTGTSYAPNTPRLALSGDGAASWRPAPKEPAGTRGPGAVAISADGATILWSPNGAGPHWSVDQGSTWTKSRGVGNGAAVFSCKVDPKRFYAQEGETTLVSFDAGATFNPVAQIPVEGRLEPCPDRKGDVWAPAKLGLYRWVEGRDPEAISGFTMSRAVGFGKPAKPGDYPTVFVIGTYQGRPGAFRSTDEGSTWIQINDAKSGYGTMGHITGDPRVFGRAYIGTNGRGIVMAEPRKTR